MRDLIDRGELVARMEEMLRVIAPDMRAANNEAYTRGFQFAINAVKLAKRAAVEASDA